MHPSPVINYHRDFSLPDLRTVECLVLLSFRLRILRYASRGDPRDIPSWRTGLDAVGLSAAAEQLFDPLLDTILAGTRRALETPQIKCRRISRDESMLLGCLAQYQNQHINDADNTLASWLLPAAARAASSLALRFSAALEANNLYLPLRYPSKPVSAASAVAASWCRVNCHQRH